MNTLKPPSCALCVQVEMERDDLRLKLAQVYEEFLAGIAREQQYHEWRDERGETMRSPISACKELAGWVRACKASIQSRQEIDQVPKSSIPEAAIGRPPNKPPGDEL